MKGITKKARAKELKRVLNKLYDEYGEKVNVIDILTDVRHLCDEYGYDFAACDKTAYQHYIAESAQGRII